MTDNDNTFGEICLQRQRWKNDLQTNLCVNFISSVARNIGWKLLEMNDSNIRLCLRSLKFTLHKSNTLMMEYKECTYDKAYDSSAEQRERQQGHLPYFLTYRTIRGRFLTYTNGESMLTGKCKQQIRGGSTSNLPVVPSITYFTYHKVFCIRL